MMQYIVRLVMRFIRISQIFVLKTENTMKLKDFGYSNFIDKYRKENGLEVSEIGRITAEHRERYIVRTEKGECSAEITGNIRFTAHSREDFPVVGDWVALISYDEDLSIIQSIFPRFSLLKRKLVGKEGEVQPIASNIDVAFIVQAVDRDFNLNRLERYLAICYDSKVEPVIIISKTDLVEPTLLDDIIRQVGKRMPEVQLISISNVLKTGIDKIKKLINPGKTYCMLGSSGVGKSTLLNNLAGEELMKTNTIGEQTQRGRHVTTHRELVILENGGILIDNPGMREIGVTDLNSGLEMTFDFIYELSKQCHYSDCTHTHEAGCAVIEAVEDGGIDEAAYENYLKIEREKSHFESTQADRKKKEKDLGKLIRGYKKTKKRNDL